MFGLQRFSAFLEKNFTVVITLQRSLRTRWEQGYLKDLYHRRVLCGAEPLLHRSAYPNWDYDSEIFAFSHRVSAPETPGNCIIRALTDRSFYTRPDVIEETIGAQPSKALLDEERDGDNSGLIEKGNVILEYVVTGYLRYSLSAAPEEMIEAVAKEITSETALSQIAKSLGFKHIIRTAEFPPNSTSLSNSFKALLAVINRKRAEELVMNTVLPQILDVDFIEVLPLKDPLGVLTDICCSEGIKNVQPRILHSAGVASAEPLYLVGIFGDGKLLGKGPGESVAIGVDIAARNTLLKKWQLTDEFIIPLGNRMHNIQLQDFQSPNYFLKEKCCIRCGFLPGWLTDLSTCIYDGSDPLKVGDMAEHYWKEVIPAVGRPLRKKLRHKFSRGSIFRRDLHRVLKPRPYTVC